MRPKDAPKICQSGSVRHKSRLKSRDSYRKYGIRTPQNMAYGPPKNMAYEPPPLLCHMNRFFWGWGWSLICWVFRSGFRVSDCFAIGRLLQSQPSFAASAKTACGQRYYQGGKSASYLGKFGFKLHLAWRHHPVLPNKAAFLKMSLPILVPLIGRREKTPTPKTRFSIWTLLRTPGRFTTRPLAVYFNHKNVRHKAVFGPW